MVTHIVTGVAGFIGSHLAETILKQGDRIVGIDQINDYYDVNQKKANIAHLQQYSNFEFIKADIQELNWLELLKDIDVIYHQAAQPGVRSSWGKGFYDYTERNINATQIILEAAKEVNSIKRFVYASSSSIYGNAEKMPTSETILPLPVSPYGITKLAAERICLLYYQNFNVPITALRYFTVYGPRQRPDMAFHKFFKAVVRNEAISIYGDGQQTRDFTFISDAVAANLAAGSIPEAIGEVFNIGGGSRVNLMDVLAIIEKTTKQPIKKEFVAKAIGDARHTSADISKAQQILGYQPKISLSEGLAKEWEWIEFVYSSYTHTRAV